MRIHNQPSPVRQGYRNVPTQPPSSNPTTYVDDYREERLNIPGLVGTVSFVATFISAAYFANGNSRALIPLVIFGVLLTGSCVIGNCCNVSSEGPNRQHIRA